MDLYQQVFSSYKFLYNTGNTLQFDAVLSVLYNIHVFF